MNTTRKQKTLHRLTAALLCLCMSASILGGFVSPVPAALAETEDIVQYSRVADPDTMDDYQNRLLALTEETGARYAGRIWTDKTVFANGDGNDNGNNAGRNEYENKHFDGKNTISLDMDTDGYNGKVKFDSDFAHVYSVLASSQVVNEYPPSPIDMVLVLDVSSSMNDRTEAAADSEWPALYSQLVDYFNSPDGQERLESARFTEEYYKANNQIEFRLKLDIPFKGYDGEIDYDKLERRNVTTPLPEGPDRDKWLQEQIDYYLTSMENARQRHALQSSEGHAIPEWHYDTYPENFADYLQIDTESTGATYGGSSRAEAAAELAFRHTRFLNLVYSADRIIKELMENNAQNRVSVVVYDRRATVLMPLAHYTANTLTADSSGKVGDKTVITSDVRSDAESDRAVRIISDYLNSISFGYLWPQFDSHSAHNDTERPTGYVDASAISVVATTTDKDEDGNTIETQDLATDAGLDSVLRLAGTNTHAGLTAGLEQLAEAKDTTLTDVLSNGQVSTVARIPVAVVMTDGGSNTVANGPWYDPGYDTPVQRSDHKNEWSSVVVAQYLLTAAYLKSAVEKNYSAYMALGDHQDLPVYTVGVDLRTDSDTWVPARLYPMLDPAKYFKGEDIPDFVDNPSAVSGRIPLGADGMTGDTSNTGIIENAYEIIQRWLAQGESGDTQVTFDFPVVAYEDGRSKGKFQQEENNSSYDDPPYRYNQYVIPFEETVPGAEPHTLNLWYKHSSGLYDSIDSYSVKYVLDWHGWDSVIDVSAGEKGVSQPGNTGSPTFDSPITGDAILPTFAQAKDGSGTYSEYGPAKYLARHAVTYIDDGTDHEKTRTVGAVRLTDIQSNLNYVTEFYDVSSAEMGGIFEQILAEVLGQVFVPISGTNDAGVGGSITYQDPIGEYMEIKNGAIRATPHHIHNDADHEGEETAYDMAILLFGEMHGLVRTGVYDYQWNDDYMWAHGLQHGVVAFPMGWYYGDDPETAVKAEKTGSDDTGTFPLSSLDGTKTYANATEARADGWVFRLDFKTMIQFVPIVDAPKEGLPVNLSDQVKNTVYTVYRFAGDTKDRNALHRNPVYGDVPSEILDAWEKAYTDGGNQYPDNNEIYADTPGVYRLSDIRVWVEDTGDFVDSDGRITPNTGYDRSLYVDVPAAAIPTELATVTLGNEGVLAYQTNMGSDHPTGDAGVSHEEYCYQSTPLRLFYAVGLEDDLIIRDENGEQDGVDFNAISPEYIQAHSVEGRDYVWFISNYYSGTRYGEFTTDETSHTRGDPTVTFSPGVDNRYYVFQKPLPLYAHAYRWDGTTLKSVDTANGAAWTDDNNRAGNGETVWEDGSTGGASWSGGQYMGTYESIDAFMDAVGGKTPGGMITDRSDVEYELVEGGIVFLTEDLLDHVTSNAGGGYESDSISFSSDDYYFILLEFYVPLAGEGKDRDGKTIAGSNAGKMVQYTLTRKGSEFGSGYASANIDNGDMLCWTDMNRLIETEFAYMSAGQTGDRTRGEPTYEKLFYTGGQLETYLKDLGIHTEDEVTVQNADGTTSTTSYLELQKAYWAAQQLNDSVITLKEQVEERARSEYGGTSDAQLKQAFADIARFAVATRPGGIRTGDMSNNLQYKGEIYDSATQLYDKNVTKTSNTYYLPTVSDNSGTDENVIINNYLGNNGYLEIPNEMLHVTKMIDTPDETLPEELGTFNYQVFVNGVMGKRSAVLTEYNAYSGTWERKLAYIDVLTDNSSLLLDNSSNRAVFALVESGGVKSSRLLVQSGTDADGDAIYYYANADGTLPTDDSGNPLETEKCPKGTALYYCYLPSNGSGTTAQRSRRLYQNPEYDAEKSAADGYPIDATHKYEDYFGKNAETINERETASGPAGTRFYWAEDAELIPVDDVTAVETPAPDGSKTMWTHDTAPGRDDHEQLRYQTMVTRRPSGETSATNFASPFMTRTAYLTVEIDFGANANENDAGGKKKGTTLTTGDLYDQVIPYVDRGDLFSGVRADAIAASTAEFQLNPGEGLLLTGLHHRVAYRVTEQLTPEQLEAGYALKQITHVQQLGSESVYKPGIQQIPVYTQEGATYGKNYSPFDRELTPDKLTWPTNAGATMTLEPFANTNAIMWQYYATMPATGAASVGSHHHRQTDPDVKEEYDIVIRDATHSGMKQTVLYNPSCEANDEPVYEGEGAARELVSYLHYIYKDGALVDPHYDGEQSSYLSRAMRYLVAPTVHFAIKGENPRPVYPAVAPEFPEYTGVYSLFGSTGWFEEQGHFVNTIHAEPGSLTVRKTVQGGDTSDAFHFTVELSNKDVTGKYGEMTFTKGVADFTLKSGESKTATLLPAGTRYTVTEAEANHNGYVTASEGEEGRVPSSGGALASFVNTLTVDVPMTGDESNPLLWAVLACACVALALMIARKQRRAS